MGTHSRPTLTVYSRSGCHLCEEMIAGLHDLQARLAFDVAVVDIATDRELTARYGEDVPVLTHGEQELCRHRIDSSRITGYLEAVSA